MSSSLARLRGPGRRCYAPFCLAVLISAFAALPGQAQADAEWYGWQTLLVDGVAVGTAVAQLSNLRGGPILGIVALSTYAAGAPFVLLAHGNRWSGLSFGGRFSSLGLMVAGLVVGFGGGCGPFGQEGATGCETRGRIGGTLFALGAIGVPVTMIVDAVLARRTIRRQEPALTLRVWSEPGRSELGLCLTLRQ